MWKVNIPHTHLAHEKSDQNWMVVKGDKINFPGGGTHFHYGADKYIASMANVRQLLGFMLRTTESIFNSSFAYSILSKISDAQLSEQYFE